MPVRLPKLSARQFQPLPTPVSPPPPPPPDFQGLKPDSRPSGRALIAAAGLTLAVVLAIALTLALPESGAVQAQEPEGEFGAAAAEVTPAAATLILSSYQYTYAEFTVSGHVGAWWIKADKGPDSGANVCKAGSQSLYTYRASGLTHNTQYTYTAYSDNACTTQLGSPVTFTTLEKKLVAIEIGQNGARLQRVGLQLGLRKAYIKGDGTAPHNICTKFDDVADIAGGRIEDTTTLTGLEPGTSYTYRSWDYLPDEVNKDCSGTETNVMTFTTLPAELTVQSLGPNSVGLQLTGHKGRDWHYKSTAGPSNRPHQTCTEQKGNAPHPINTVNLGGLTKDTEYTYTAYTNSACTAGNELDDNGVTFTTLATAPTLTVSYVSPTTAKLTISGYTGIWYYSSDSWYSGRCGYAPSNVASVYLTDLTPGVTYTFKTIAPVTGQEVCTAAMATAAPFTTPAQLTECDGLSITSAGVTTNRSDAQWSRYVYVKNNTDDAMHNVRVFTYYTTGIVSSLALDSLYHLDGHEDTIPEVQPGATGRIVYDSDTTTFATVLAELNGVVQLVDPVDQTAVLCETAIEPSWWRTSRAGASAKDRANPEYRVSAQLDNPLPGAGENATFTITAYAGTDEQLLQACVNIHFDGLAPVDADDDGNHDVVIYDGPNGKYQEDGTLNSGGYGRAGRLDYDSDGYDEDVASWRHRPQCSDAAGKFEGGLFRIGNTERRTSSAVKWPTTTGAQFLPLTYTVKVPVAATASGSGCVTATVRALPPEQTDNLVTAYEKTRDNTAKACLGPPPSGDPELPVVFQKGRADLMTVHKCADGVNFPCAGKSAGDLVQYAWAGDDVFNGRVATDGSGNEWLAYVGSGNAAQNAGSAYRAFHTEDTVTHVADFTTTDSNDPVRYEADGGRRVRIHPTSSPAKTVWYTGHDLADEDNRATDFGSENLKGVDVKYRFLGTDYNKYYMSICPKHDAGYLADPTDTTAPCDASVADTNPGTMRALYWRYWNYALLNMAGTQPTSNFNRLSWQGGNASGAVFEFGDLGTYVADIIIEGRPTAGTVKSVGRHTFHVGPAADLSVRSGGASTSVASGKRAFTIVAESEATAEIDTEFTLGSGLHKHREQVNLHTLIPEVTVTADGSAIPAADVSQVGASAGSYDTATGVWTLPEGFQGTATLTLVADASAVSSVKAVIANSAEVCENAAGVHQDVDNPGTSTLKTSAGREACEWYLKADGTREQHSNADKATGYHWGAYQRCIKTDATAVGLDPDHTSYIVGETACTNNAATNTWHTTEVYDWRPNNNTVTFTPDDTGFTLNARGAGRTSIDLRWAKQVGADDYAIYSMSTADLTSTDNLSALLGPNQIAVVSGDTTAYYHDGLAMGEKRQYLIRARQDRRPVGMSQLASATAEIPDEPWAATPESRAPGSVGSMKAARDADNENNINVSWNAPSSGAFGYEVQYQSLPSGGSWSGWTILTMEQPGTSYTLYKVGGGGSYRFRVRAINIYGGQIYNGSWSSSGTVAPVSNPNQVANLVAARDTTDVADINVSWEAPFAGTTPTGYDVQYRSRTGNSGAWGSWNVEATGQTGMSYKLEDTATVADSYEFRVRGVTVSGGDTIYGAWRTAGIVRAYDNPDQVRNLTATRNFSLETTINVAWDAPGAGTTPTGYGVEYQEDGGAWVVGVANQTDLTDLTYDLTTAEGGKRYRFRVRAVTRTDDVTAGANASASATDCPSDSICGSWAYSATVAAVATPGQVGSLTAIRVGNDDRKINVSWTPPSNATGNTTYDIERKEDGGAWKEQDRVTGHTATLNNDGKMPYQFGSATGNKTYQFQVRAVTRSGGNDLEGSWRSSNTVPVLSPPGQVGMVLAARLNSDEKSITATWTAPSSGTPTGYHVQYRANGTGDWLPSTPTEVTGTSHTITTAAGQSTYQFRVRAYVTPSSGDDLEGSWRTSNTVPRVPTPGQVGSLTAARVSGDDTKIDVAWTAPSNATATTTYDIEYKADNASDWTSAKTDHAASPYQLTTATGKKRYQFRVRAVTESDGSDLEGSWRTSNTLPVLPPPNQVGNVSATRDADNDTIIKVEWTAPSSGTAPTNYDIEYKQDNASDWENAATGHTAIPVNGKIPYTFTHTGGGASTYQFRVRASKTLAHSNDTLKGSWRTSNIVPKLRAPNQVGSVTATRDTTTETTIKIDWTAPSSGTTPSGYDLEYKANDAADWTELTDVENGLTHSWTGAAGGSKYQFRVSAYVTLKDADATKLKGSWRTSNTVAGLPAGPITTIEMTRGTSDPTTITVTWSESARASAGYEVEYRQDSGSWRSATKTGQNDTRTHTQENAGGVEDYTFRVRGVSGNGGGPWKESTKVDAPTTIGYHGAKIGVDYITLKVTSGPWWFEYRDHKGDWSSCKRVASGNDTLTNLRPERTHLFDLYSSSGCSADQFGGRQSLKTLSEINNWDKCWNTDDCRNIDNPNDMSKHTHKRSRLAQFGVTISGCDWSTRETHTHGWPDGGYGAHWHCKID